MIYWAMNINIAQRELKNVRIRARIQGEKFVELNNNLIQATYMSFNANGSQNWDNGYHASFPDAKAQKINDGKELLIELGDLKGVTLNQKSGDVTTIGTVRSVLILYQSNYEPTITAVNTVTFEADGIEPIEITRVRNAVGAGGGVNTNNYGNILIANKDGNNFLTGGEFRITKLNDNSIVKQVTITEKDVKHAAFVPSGTYRIEQIKAPDGYKIAQSIEIPLGNEETKTVTFKNERKKGKIRITSKDANGMLVSGAKFELLVESSGISKQENIQVTEVNGKLLENIPYGTYEIKMTTVASGFRAETTQIRVVVNDETTPAEANFVSRREVGSIEVKSIDRESARLIEGVEYELLLKNTMIPYTNISFTKQSNGNLLASDVPTGNYIIRQKTYPMEYKRVDGQPIEIFSNQKTNVTFVNELKKENLTITLQDENRQPISGARFEIFKVDESTRTSVETSVGIETTDIAGKVIQNLSYGKYKVRQTITLDKYEIANPAEQAITLNANNKDLTFTNETKKGTLKITVKNQQGQVLNALADITQNGRKIRENIRVENGEASVLLPSGDYIVVQKEVEGYNLPSSQNVTIGYNQEGIVNFINQLKPDRVKIILVGKEKESDIQKEALQNIELKIADDNNFSRIIRTEADGAASIELNPGTYTITQISEHPHYDKSQQASLIVEGGGKKRMVEIINIRKKRNLTITLQDENRQPIVGARFEIFKVDESTGTSVETSVGSGTTDIAGKAIQNLSYGKYKVRQTSTLDKYEIANPAEQTITLNANNKDLTFTNETKKGNLTIALEDENQNPIVGARFEIFKVDESTGTSVETSVGIGTTDIAGKAIQNLSYGKYKVRQTSTLDKYEIANPAEQTITLNANNKDLTFTNETKKGNLTIALEDENQNPIVGARFEIFKVDESTGTSVETSVGDGTTDDIGKITKTLPYGKYKVRQMSTLDKHIVEIDDKEVTIDNNNNDPLLQFVNIKLSDSNNNAGGTGGGNGSSNDGQGNQNGGASDGNGSSNDGQGNQNGETSGNNDSSNDGQESQNPNGSSAEQGQSNRDDSTSSSSGDVGGYNPQSSVRPDPYSPNDSALNKEEEPNMTNEETKTDEVSIETDTVENSEEEFENEISASDVTDEKISLSNRESSETQEKNQTQKSSQSSVISKEKIPLILPSALPKTGGILFEKILSPEFMWKFFGIGFLTLGLVELNLRRKNRN
ncbi:MAG: SpaA isopeptide-forming pilin-related protein [Peptostreptococcaceae bacterium]|nr:SpaA isopeptide-forming pilin-related protein [Peptostreptococcaceae bacterium]